MCVLLRCYFRQVGVETGIEPGFCKLGLCEVGETLLVELILELLEAQDEVENFGIVMLGNFGEACAVAIGGSTYSHGMFGLGEGRTYILLNGELNGTAPAMATQHAVIVKEIFMVEFLIVRIQNMRI